MILIMLIPRSADIRHEAHIQKTGQPGFMFDTDSPKSRKALALQHRYAEAARKRVLAVLVANKGDEGVEYRELFCEAMFFPLVTPNDLVKWLKSLEPNLEFNLAGASTRKKPLPSQDDRVVVLNAKALQ